MPTYDEIVNENEEDFSGDEELLIKQDTFERKYNFRYEEPGAAEVMEISRKLLLNLIPVNFHNHL
jgi:protein KRI1